MLMRWRIYPLVVLGFVFAGVLSAEATLGCYQLGPDSVVCGVPVPGSHVIYGLSLGLLGVAVVGFIEAVTSPRRFVNRAFVFRASRSMLAALLRFSVAVAKSPTGPSYASRGAQP